jgi:branched-chain amino acid transport system permease protein
MSPELFVQFLINGLMSGGTYVLVASGLTLILGVTPVSNFAQGEFYMLGAFITKSGRTPRPGGGVIHCC